MSSIWRDVTYFMADEFDSPDLPGSGMLEMNPTLLVVLDKIRKDYGKPIRINSAYRTRLHNESVGGVNNSQHRKGNAVDIHIETQGDGDRLERLFNIHFPNRGGIGRYNTFIHLDVRNKRTEWDNRT